MSRRGALRVLAPGPTVPRSGTCEPAVVSGRPPASTQLRARQGNRADPNRCGTGGPQQRPNSVAWDAEPTVRLPLDVRRGPGFHSRYVATTAAWRATPGLPFQIDLDDACGRGRDFSGPERRRLRQLSQRGFERRHALAELSDQRPGPLRVGRIIRQVQSASEARVAEQVAHSQEQRYLGHLVLG